MPYHDAPLTNVLDVAWILALWKALHGGDPSPEAVAAEVIAALSQYLECSPGMCEWDTSKRHVC